MQTDIAAAPDVVWSLISDVTRMGEWSPEATGAIWKGDASGPDLGAKFTGTNANGKKAWKTDCEVTTCEPGRAFAFRHQIHQLLVQRFALGERFAFANGGLRQSAVADDAAPRPLDHHVIEGLLNVSQLDRDSVAQSEVVAKIIRFDSAHDLVRATDQVVEFLV